jgi:DNA-binding transcriptional LysR family regulator
MREMEKQLGCRLFDRTTRVVSLTPAGRRLLPVVERLVTDLDDVAAAARRGGRRGAPHACASRPRRWCRRTCCRRCSPRSARRTRR